MTRIKLCGLRRPEDIRCANAVRPDYVGFVFAEKSSRTVSPATAKALRAELAEGITAVGVFVDAPVRTVAALLNENTIDMAQLHGREDAAYIAALRARTKKPLIQAFRVMMATHLTEYLPERFLQAYAQKHPMKRMTNTEDVADVIAFLCSDGARFLNGVNLPVNGGEAF